MRVGPVLAAAVLAGCASCAQAQEIKLLPPKRPVWCPQIYKPVCGVNGHTYGNGCGAAAAGVAVKSNGVCPASTTPPQPCTPKQDATIVLCPPGG